MTAINTATQIPKNIVTLEQLVTWGLLTLAFMYPDKSTLETDTRRESTVQNGIFTSAEDTSILLLRYAAQLDPTYITVNTPLWMSTKELGSGNIPSAYAA